MGEFPNKDTQFKKGSTKAVQSGQKGGQGNKNTFQKKSLGQTTRWLRAKGLKGDSLKWFEQCLIDPEADLANIQKYISDIIGDLHPAQRVAMANTMIGLHDAKFGRKQTNQNLNINVNMDLVKFKELTEKYEDE